MPRATIKEPVAVCHPELLSFVVLRPGDEYDENDPLVRTFGWAFEPPVERATAGPGEKRATAGNRKAGL
jgi:hypothetical protein